MSKQYIIRWKSTVNGRAGKGTKLFDREAAERLVEELNREYPQIVHEIVEADLSKAIQSPEPEPAEAASASGSSESQPEPESIQAGAQSGYTLSFK